MLVLSEPAAESEAQQREINVGEDYAFLPRPRSREPIEHWCEEELRHRRAAFSAIGYRRRRAFELQARGDTERAARLLGEAAGRHRVLTKLGALASPR